MSALDGPWEVEAGSQLVDEMLTVKGHSDNSNRKIVGCK